jgi:putative ABC transport system substrate-binding protein
MKRREFISLIGGAAVAWPLAAHAQQPAKILQVGFLYPGPPAAVPVRIAAFTSGLQAGGLRVPDQAMIIPSATDGNAALLAPLATDLVARKVDVICVAGPEAVRAARAATTTIPIVAIDLESDPTDSGFITSYARPGGNLTGVFLDFPDFSKKWLEALKEAVPKISSVAIFWIRPWARSSFEQSRKRLKFLISNLSFWKCADAPTQSPHTNPPPNRA